MIWGRSKSAFSWRSPELRDGKGGKTPVRHGRTVEGAIWGVMPIIRATSSRTHGASDFLTLRVIVGFPEGNGREGSRMYTGAMIAVHVGI